MANDDKVKIVIEAVDETRKAINDVTGNLDKLKQTVGVSEGNLHKLNNALLRMNVAFAGGRLDTNNLIFALAGLGGKFSIVGGAIATVTAGLVAYIKNIKDAKAATESLSSSLGLSASTLESSRKFTGEMGISKGQSDSLIKAFSDAQYKALQGDAKTRDTFKQLGVDFGGDTAEEFQKALSSSMDFSRTKEFSIRMGEVFGQEYTSILDTYLVEAKKKYAADTAKFLANPDYNQLPQMQVVDKLNLPKTMSPFGVDPDLEKLVDTEGQRIIEQLNKEALAAEQSSARVRNARESELQLLIKKIDLEQQNLEITRPEAVRERVAAYNELLQIQNESIALLDKEKDPSSWYAQMNAINATKESLISLNMELREQTGSLTQGFAYGIQNFFYNTQTSFQVGVQAATTAAQMMQSGFKNLFFDVMDGKIKSLKDGFKSLLKMVTEIFKQIASQMMMQGIMSLLGMFGGMGFSSSTGSGWAGLGGGTSLGGGMAIVHTGGLIAGKIPRFHSGLAPDEVPAILQTGERVLSRQQNKTFDKLAKNISGENDTVVVNQTMNFPISAMDGQDVERTLQSKASIIRGIVADGVNNSRGYAKVIRGDKN